jgi:hypothetical protein
MKDLSCLIGPPVACIKAELSGTNKEALRLEFPT